MAKYRLTTFKQSDLPMHEYSTKFSDLAEHAYNIKPTDEANQILPSNFIEGVHNPHVKNK